MRDNPTEIPAKTGALGPVTSCARPRFSGKISENRSSMKNIMFTFCSNFNSPIQKCFEYTFVRVSLEKVMGFDLSIEGTQPIVRLARRCPPRQTAGLPTAKEGVGLIVD
jgi:hypothetical protein